MLELLHADTVVVSAIEARAPFTSLTCPGGDMRAVGNPGRACRGVAVCACRFVWMENR